MDSYIPVFVMIVIGALIAFVMVFGSALLGPKKPGAVKASPYECGMTPVGSARERFPIKFYLVAMIFIVFDVETIFLYPWAVNYRHLPYALKAFNYIEMVIFVAIIFAGYLYILGKGALDWGEEEAVAEALKRDPIVLAPRPAIRFGNENSGPVDLEKIPVGPRVPVYGASAQELCQPLEQTTVRLLPTGEER